jgi:tetratricopeptide (TPR) repeat protein
VIALVLGTGLTVISAETAADSPPSWACAYVAERLPRALGLLGDDTVSAEETREARRGLALSEAVLTRASNLVLARTLGASRLIVVRCRDAGVETALEAQDFDAERPVSGPVVRVVRPRADLAAAIDEVASRFAGAPAPGRLDGYRAPLPPALSKAGPALALERASERARGLAAALQDDPASIDLRLSTVEALVGARDFDLAARLGEAALPKDTPPALARALRFQAGSARLEAGRYAEAAETFEALRKDGETAAVLNNLGVARFRLREPKASELFTRASSLPDPRAQDLAFNRSLALIFEGDAQAALSTLDPLMEGAPADARARLLRVWALRMLDREAERAIEWERLMAEAPSFAPLARPDLARRLERIFRSERCAELGPRSPW